MTVVEVAVGLAVLGIVASAGLASFISLNKNAVRTRIMTNAKEVVQRNIETAMGVPFLTTSEPSILQITGTSGSTWDDDGGSDNKVTIYSSRDSSQQIKGDLKRIVLPESNSAGADIRRVTFHLDYNILGTPVSYEMTTIRALDK